MTTYNLSQQISIICSASNIANSTTGTQDALQKLISQGLQPTLDGMEIGNWKVVWLNVWKANPGDSSNAADHVWFVAQNPATVFEDGKSYNTYVVSVAGLTPTSVVNLLEATLIGQVVDFEKWDPATTPPPIAFSVDDTKSYLSLGCALGVSWLLTVPNSDGVSLHKFLGTIPPTSRVIFTGASLGGMLSPALAMAAIKAQSSEVPVSQIFTYPVSGPSAGNGAYADLYASTFPRIKTGDNIYENWNSLLWNTYDIVPHAWNIDSDPGRNLSKIPALYGPLSGLVKVIVDVGVGLAEVLPRSAPVVYTPLQGTEFTPSDKPNTPEDFQEWATIMGEQHTLSYLDVMNVPFVPPLTGNPGPEERAQQVPLFKLFDEARKEKEKEIA